MRDVVLPMTVLAMLAGLIAGLLWRASKLRQVWMRVRPAAFDDTGDPQVGEPGLLARLFLSRLSRWSAVQARTTQFFTALLTWIVQFTVLAGAFGGLIHFWPLDLMKAVLVVAIPLVKLGQMWWFVASGEAKHRGFSGFYALLSLDLR